MWCLLNLTVLTEVKPITILLYSGNMFKSYICSNLQFHVWHYTIMDFILSKYGLKADAKDFVVLVFTGNAHFQWIWSDNFCSRDSALPMAVGEKHRLYNKLTYFFLLDFGASCIQSDLIVLRIFVLGTQIRAIYQVDIFPYYCWKET